MAPKQTTTSDSTYLTKIQSINKQQAPVSPIIYRRYMRITIRQERTLSSERDSIRHHLGTLLAQETQSRAPSRPRHIPSTFTSHPEVSTEVFICEFCSRQHTTTECPNTPQLVYDQADTPPRPRRPNERLDRPATWLSLHRATLHYLVSSILRYFRILHNDQTYRVHLFQDIRSLLEVPSTNTLSPSSSHLAQNHESPEVATHELPPSLFELAVAATVAKLHVASLPIHNVNDPLLVTICDRFYSPIFGHSPADYREAVYLHYHA
jgi:hypothetical protein